MTEEPKFQAPPMPPKAPAFGAPSSSFGAAAPKAEPAKAGDIPPNNFAAALKLSPRIFETKIMAAILAGCLIVGLLLGMAFSGGGSSAPKTVMPQDAIRGVIGNPDVREKLNRCGMVSATSPCVVYIVNHSRDDHYAEYFFDEAAKLTGRAPYRVRIDNQHYAKSRIPPGYIAKIKIPRL